MEFYRTAEPKAARSMMVSRQRCSAPSRSAISLSGEPEPAGVAGRAQVYRVSDLALASRLSFFLWSSIPDDELIDLPRRVKLADRRARAAGTAGCSRIRTPTRSDQLHWPVLSVRSLRTSEPVVNLFPDFG